MTDTSKIVLSKVVFHKLYVFLSSHYTFKMEVALFYIEIERQIIPWVTMCFYKYNYQILFASRTRWALLNIINVLDKIVYVFKPYL